MKFFLSVLFFIVFSLSCSIFNNTRDYESYINLAENFILRDKYLTAQEFYEKAFKSNHPGFAKDYYNALQVGERNNDGQFSNKNAKHLRKLGMCFDFFLKFPILKDSIVLEELERNIYQFNTGYRNELEKLFNLDQEIRLKRGSKKEINSVDSLNFIAFKKLIKKYGFPSEDVIGIECTANNRGIQPPPFRILLLHFAQRQYDGIRDILQNALDEKSLSPYQFMDLIQFTDNNKKYYPTPVLKVGKEYFTYKLNDSLKAIINQNRMEIGVETIENQVQKTIKYRLQKGKDGFRFHVPIDGLPLLEKSLMDSLFIKIEI